MNILFSDVFAADFATIGNIATREEMDSGKAANEMYFWEQVQDAFVTPGDISTYNELQFVGDDGDDIFNSQHHINLASLLSMIGKNFGQCGRESMRNTRQPYLGSLFQELTTATFSDFVKVTWKPTTCASTFSKGQN